jgi:hypothetical protein
MLLLPLLRPDQSLISLHPARIKIISMGRRWGKTTMAGSVCIACANDGAAVAWVVPTYKNARPVWRFAESIVRKEAARVGIRRSDRIIEFPSGGWLAIYTADNPTSILGEAFDLVIMEEAARVSPDVWSETLLPTLADRSGQAMLISTPRGRNWFWQEFQRGMADGNDQASFTAPTSANPMPTIRRAFDMARLRVSDRAFRQEWLAEFVEDGAGVFRNVRALSTLAPIAAVPGTQYLIGVDWGRTNDATVLSVWDIGRRQEVALDYFTDLPFSVQYQRVQALAKRYTDALVIAEANNAQDAHVEALARAGVRVMPFITTNATKAVGVDTLAGALERGDVGLQADERGILEMEAFESSRTPSGLVRYAAPEGLHDDIPMARVIAYSGVAQSAPALAWE